MKIQVLGGHGGKALGFNTTSFLIDDVLLLDAGDVAGTLSVKAQTSIDHILISHCHLDHIKDLAFISDNCFGLKDKPFAVYAHPTVKKHIKDHLLNNVIWPDFTELPSKEKPTMEIHPLEVEKTIKLGRYEITPVSVNHDHDALGYIIDDGVSAVLFTSDTGPTERIWEIGKSKSNLKAIFTEVSFPNKLQNVADISFHHTPNSIREELKKMPAGAQVVLTHFKPNYKAEIFQEMQDLKERVSLLENDGQIFNF